MLRQDRDFSTIGAGKRQFAEQWRRGKNSVIYMGLISGPNKADDTCEATMVTGMMDRGFTVHDFLVTYFSTCTWHAYVATHNCT
jgi:hypothetical protein